MTTPDRVTCNCGCTLKNQKYHKVHLGTEKHQFMLDNNGDLRAWQRMVVRRGVITDLRNALAKQTEGTMEWETAKRILEAYEADNP